jgi:hypothetical protein
MKDRHPGILDAILHVPELSPPAAFSVLTVGKKSPSGMVSKQ